MNINMDCDEVSDGFGKGQIEVSLKQDDDSSEVRECSDEYRSLMKDERPGIYSEAAEFHPMNISDDHESYCTGRQEPIAESICIQPMPEMADLPLQFKHEIDDGEALHDVTVRPGPRADASQSSHVVRVVQPKQESEDLEPDSDAKDRADATNAEAEDGERAVKDEYARPRRQPKYRCQSCGRGYSHARTLESHSRTCGRGCGPRRTRCLHPSCTREFFHRFRMLEHYERDHVDEGASCVEPGSPGEEPERKVRCAHPSCGREFAHSSVLLRHVKREHPETEAASEPALGHVCRNCLRGYAHPSGLRAHERACGSRSKVRKTPCVSPSCRREFFHRCRLLRHVQEEHPEVGRVAPAGEAGFGCAGCGREYSHERSLRSHARTCGKRGKLRRTPCVHSSCAREFFHKTRMMRHVRRDHPDVEEAHPDAGFRCPNCRTVYGRLQSLQEHSEACGVGGKLRKTRCIHPSCERLFFHVSSMVKHLEGDHGDVEVSVLEEHFASLAHFRLWKEDEEVRSCSRFSTRHSVTSDDGRAYLCLVCQHDGPDGRPGPRGGAGGPPQRGRKRKGGRVKTGIVCPARMLVKESGDGSVSVKYVKTHNHEIERGDVARPPTERRTSWRHRAPTGGGSETAGRLPADSGDEAPGRDKVSIKEDMMSGEMIAEAVMGTGYFDYMVKPYCGYVRTLEKANETVRLFQQRTSSRFICYKVERTFGRDGWCAENRKILWQQEELRENTLPEFDGVPYILNGTKVLECQYGVNRSTYQKKQNSEKRKQEEDTQGHISKKVDCRAKIFLKDVIKFPDYKVETNSRQEKKIKANLLRLALKDGRVESERRIYVQLPKESDHCNHGIGTLSKPQKPRGSRLLLHPCWDAYLNDIDFLLTFRVTRSLFQFLASEWQKEEVARLEAAGLSASEVEPLNDQILAALYYLGCTDSLASSSTRFRVKASRFLDVIVKFADFLLKQSDKYLKWPPVEERVQIAEIIKQDCGFPGVFGAMDASLIHMTTPIGDDNYSYAYASGETEAKCAFVLQFIVDHRLTFRDIHLDSPKTGTRIQVFQESDVWLVIQNLTSAETHLVAPAVYPLAPAIMTPHMTEILSYQEALYNENHQAAHKLTTNAMTVFKSRFRRMQMLDDHVETSAKLVKAACVLHNIALMNENEMVLNDLGLEYNSELDEEGWHTVNVEEVVAEIGILGGEEKRHYLTTVMTPR